MIANLIAYMVSAILTGFGLLAIIVAFAVKQSNNEAGKDFVVGLLFLALAWGVAKLGGI